MNKFKLILIALLSLSLYSCSPSELDQYEKNGQWIELSYEEYTDKINNNEDFVFVLTKEECTSCKQYYPFLAEYFESNPGEVLYNLKYESFDAVNAVTLAAYVSKVLGQRYFDDKDLSNTSLYTPTTVKVESGKFISASIGVMDLEEINIFMIDNYYSYKYYYNFSKLISEVKTFKIFVSLSQDNDYDSLLRTYFVNNEQYDGYYLDCSAFSDEDSYKLLDRINYYLGEENGIEHMPTYFYLEYENGDMVNFVKQKFDNDSLSELYK